MEKDLEAANKRADEWEAVATTHEQTLIELRESLDIKDIKAMAAKEFAGFVQEWMTYTFPCAEDCDHTVQQVLDIYLNYLKQPKQSTEVEL
jgi:broad specificity phosphatase PhoE